MAKESKDGKHARKAAAKESARARAAQIRAGEIPEWLLNFIAANNSGQLKRTKIRSATKRKPGPKTVKAQKQLPARALKPPSSAPLPEFEREHYANNAMPRQPPPADAQM